ncbi:MAG: cytochrome d ubiquinol oxidase subunit II [Myxococcota bacterium]
MNSLELYWYVMGVGLVAYVLTGGADFGGGVWDLLASGPRRDEMRKAVEDAIAPIWEANHVWLIFVVVVMFTVFPRAFAVVGTALHIPLTLALIGIVLRGTAFTFRAYGLEPDHRRRAWGRVFAWSSALTPIFLGAALGGASTGAIRLSDGQVTTGFFAGWTTVFAGLVGLFALALFVLLAAVYLTADTTGPVQEEFRRRAIVSEVVAGVLAAGVFWRARIDAPPLYDHLAGSDWTWIVQTVTALLAFSTLALVWFRRYHLARFTVAGQVAMVVVGWGLAMDGHIVLPDLALADSGSHSSVRAAMTPALLVGTLLLAPALLFLFHVFKSGPRSAS